MTQAHCIGSTPLLFQGRKFVTHACLNVVYVSIAAIMDVFNVKLLTFWKMVCVDQIVLTQAVTFITEYVLSAILHVPLARVAGLITAYSVKICITWTVDFVLLNVQQTNIRWVTGHVDVRVAVNNALINPLLSARNVSSLQTLSSTALAYHPAPPTPFSLGTNVCNVQTTA